MKRMMLVAALVLAAMSFGQRPAAASGDAPWCAFIAVGEDAIYEDCQYRTFEECRPNVLAGNRGFCNPNPRWDGRNAPKAKSAGKHRKRHARRH